MANGQDNTIFKRLAGNGIHCCEFNIDFNFWKGTGSLSIKTFSSGRAYYNAGRGHFMVEEGRYLLLNCGQDYSITIESESPVESFCIFFPEGMIEEVYHSLAASDSQLLDCPFDKELFPLEFVEKTYNNDELLFSAVPHLRKEYRNQDGGFWIEEKLHEILYKLLAVHRKVYCEMMKLPSQRTATKEELYRRLHIGHDYMAAYFNRKISLKEVASVACLSPTHF